MKGSAHALRLQQRLFANVPMHSSDLTVAGATHHPVHHSL
jgi:hypothetical protein